jgi:hypothetical protein
MSANCASMTRSRARRDRGGIVGPSMMASRTREAAGWCVSATPSCCCEVNDSMDRIRVGRHRVFYHVCTYQVRAHYAAHGAAKAIAEAACQSLWAQEGRMLLRLAIFGSISQDNHLVARDLVAQCILYWRRQHIPMRRDRNNHTMS